MKKCIRGEWSKNVVIEYVKWKKSCFANFVMDDISLKKKIKQPPKRIGKRKD